MALSRRSGGRSRLTIALLVLTSLALLTLDFRDMRRLCSTYPDGSDESCGPDNDTVDAVGLLGVSAALLF